MNQILNGKVALVTGASDGIGKAIARELYYRGFNLIIHGRNEEKLRKVREQIQAQGGGRDVRLWVQDAHTHTLDFTGALKQWSDLEITLVIHNVGGSPPRAESYVTKPVSYRTCCLTAI